MIRKTAGNPLITSIYTADPSARSWDGETLYIYCSRDVDPARGCDLMDRYHVFSTKDLANWTDCGEILRSEDVSWGRPEGGFMWAPDCAFRNGKYYYYYPHPSDTKWNDSWKIGVAVSDFPDKGFKDVGYIDGLGGFALIDPNVFTDDDGQAYIYYGGGGKCFGAKLAEDMIHVEGDVFPMEGLHDFHEATWVFKRGGLYYITYSDNEHAANNMRYCVSKSPLGPWEHKGFYLAPVGCETTHGSVVEFKGKWYQFYHNNAISGHGELRSVCADELFFGENGEMKLITQTKEGLAAINGDYAEPKRTVYKANGRIFEVDGGKGGRVNILIRYKTAERLAKVRLTINGQNWDMLNCLGELGETNETVTLGAGINRVIIKPAGEIEILTLETAFLDQ